MEKNKKIGFSLIIFLIAIIIGKIFATYSQMNRIESLLLLIFAVNCMILFLLVVDE